MNRKNLRILQRVLLQEALEDEARPAGVFNLNLWSSSETPSCGTTACALGSLALSGKIQGLKIKRVLPGVYAPVYEDADSTSHYDFTAGAVALDISEELAQFLFYPFNYPVWQRTGPCSALEVAQRVQDILDGHNIGVCQRLANLRARKAMRI